MIDFHSHILPAIDDGSKNEEESLKMLEMLSQQGISTVCATPHFNPDKESVNEFIKRRQDAYDKLKPKMTSQMPEIILGAEIAYYEGLSNLSDLQKLCIGNTKLLLVEMPMSKWSEFAVDELKKLSNVKGYTIIIAHIERYMNAQSSDTLRKLRSMGVLSQVNASFFIRLTTRKKAIRMLRNGEINAIGSDCHNLEHRPPCMKQAFEIIKKKTSETFLSEFAEYQRDLII